MTFRPTSWASQQKSRVDALMVPPSDEESLKQFQIAMSELSPRVATVIRKKSTGRGKNKVETERTEHFWSDSIVRPLIADNLARGQPWYRGFVNLMTKLDPVSKKPLRLRLFFEKEGLKAMTEKIAWTDQGESAVVRSVHEALRRRFGAIASENKGKTGTMKNRMTGEFNKWRLAFAGAKTADRPQCLGAVAATGARQPGEKHRVAVHPGRAALSTSSLNTHTFETYRDKPSSGRSAVEEPAYRRPLSTIPAY